MDITFKIVVPKELGEELSQEFSEINSIETPATPPPAALRLGLVEAVAIATVVLSTVQVIEVSCKIIDRIKRWKQKKQLPRILIVVQGRHEHLPVEIDDKSDLNEIAVLIERTVI